MKIWQGIYSQEWATEWATEWEKQWEPTDWVVDGEVETDDEKSTNRV